MNHCISFLTFCFFAFNVSAQEMWGISNSNFSGNMGIFLNPSTIVSAPYKYEFNLVAADIFAQTSYIYIPKESKFIFRAMKGQVGDEKNIFDIYNTNLQNGFGHTLVIGPSYIQNNGSNAWGIHTAYRNEVSALNVPSPIAKFIFEKYNFAPLINQSFSAGSFSADWLSWGELGGTYGRTLFENQENFFKVAGTLNLLAGFDGLYLDSRKLDYTIYDSSTAIIHSMDATIAHATPAGGNGSFLAFRGYGASTTLGATYIHRIMRGGYDCNNRSADRLKKYDYRVGFSLMDLGFIHFFNNDATVLNVNTSTDRLWGRIDTVTFQSIAHLDTLLSNNVNGTVISTRKQSFNMYLPAAISLQFDYCFVPRIYGNVSLVNRIYYSPKEVARGNQLDLSIRYEKRKWEATADFTLFEYKQPSVGVGFRFWIFVIGTDRLMELLSLTDVKAFDFFFGFKLNTCDFGGKKSRDNCPAFGSR